MAARDAGYEVSVVTQVDRHGEPIRAQGLRLIPIRLSRQGTNPFQELALIVRLYRIYRRERPDIVHQVAMKPVIYGSLVARLTGVHGILNAMAGLGFLFSFRSLKARLLRPLVRGRSAYCLAALIRGWCCGIRHRTGSDGNPGGLSNPG